MGPQFKRSLVGFNRKAVDEAIQLKKNEISALEAEVDSLTQIALEGQARLTRRLYGLTIKFEDTRESYLLVKKLHENLSDLLLRLQSVVGRQESVVGDEISNLETEIQTLASLINNVENDSPSGFDEIKKALSELAAGHLLPVAEPSDIDLVCNWTVQECTFAGDTSGFTVLVAEDDPETSRLLNYILSRENFTVIMVSSGRELLKLIEVNEPPDLILLEIKLPYIDGLQLTKTIRATASWRDVRVIILSANHSERDILDSFEAGADDCVRKPFNIRELIARVRRYCYTCKTQKA